MGQIGEVVTFIVGASVTAAALRFGWSLGLPLAMWATGKMGEKKQIKWRSGTAVGRPDVRYVEDGWGRIVWMELDPDATTTTPTDE
jgi:hypothetical protein